MWKNLRTGGTIVTFVIGDLTLEAALALLLANILCPELLPGLAGVFIKQTDSEKKKLEFIKNKA